MGGKVGNAGTKSDQNKRRRGRPANEDYGIENRKNVLRVRLTDSENAELQDILKQTDMSKSTLIGALIHYHGQLVKDRQK